MAPVTPRGWFRYLPVKHEDVPRSVSRLTALVRPRIRRPPRMGSSGGRRNKAMTSS